MNKLAENLKKLMQAKHLTASELARKTGIGQPVINRIMNGVTTNPNVGTLGPIAAFFSISISDLITEISPQKSSVGTYVKESLEAHEVPLISWQEATHWKVEQKIYHQHPLVMTHKGVTPDAFAVKINEEIDSRFPKDTILIIEPHKKAKHRDFLLVQRGSQRVAFLKRLIQQGDSFYLKDLDPAFKAEKLTNEYKILGVLVQSIFDFD